MASKINLSENDKTVLRRLGEWKVMTAGTPANREKIKVWTDHDNGVPGSRVMVRCETWYTQEDRKAVMETDLECAHPWAQDLERDLRYRKFEIETMREDNFVLPWIEYHPAIDRGDFGLPQAVERDRAGGVGFHYTPSLKTLDDADFAKIHHREPAWDKDKDEMRHAVLEDVFRGICGVRRRLHGWQLAMPMTSTAYDFVGLDGFMLLIYDNPAGLTRLMKFIWEDHLAYLAFLEYHRLLNLNNEADYIGSGCMGCSRNLPSPDFKGQARPQDLWCFAESQESVSMSPAHYGEFVFPYLKDIAERFGRVYYGCCEPVDRVWQYVSTIRNLQRVSVSPWADEKLMGQYCREKKIVYSRKPSPNLFMGPVFDEGAVRAHLEKTVACAQGCRLEFIHRDIYITNNEPQRFVRWVELAREAGTKHQG
jgi:hypothetical protein